MILGFLSAGVIMYQAFCAENGIQPVNETFHPPRSKVAEFESKTKAAAPTVRMPPPRQHTVLLSHNIDCMQSVLIYECVSRQKSMIRGYLPAYI